MLATIGVSEARTHFAQLLGRAERGEEIVITRRGKPVARLGPLPTGHDREAARAAAARLRALAEDMNLGRYDWRNGATTVMPGVAESDV